LASVDPRWHPLTPVDIRSPASVKDYHALLAERVHGAEKASLRPPRLMGRACRFYDGSPASPAYLGRVRLNWAKGS